MNPGFPNLEFPLLSGLNFLLRSEPWARERLLPFAGETLELRAAPLPALRFCVGPDGTLVAAAPAQRSAAPATLVLSIGPGALAAAAKGEEHLLRAVEVAGNARLASEIMFLIRHLRWDAEESLARVVGDVAAHRVVETAKSALAQGADAARRIAEGLVEYAAEEKRLLVGRRELEEIAAALAKLRDGLERLDKRLGQLGN